MQQSTFDELARLLDTDPAEYRARLNHLREHEPEVLTAYVENMRQELEAANEREDRALTDDELEDLILNTADALGWSRERVVSEGVLRLRAAALYGEGGAFKPLTPEPEPASRVGAYKRRYSSIRALALGEIRAALKAHTIPPLDVKVPPKA